ncbi:GspE/PulE family protein [Candidatus Saccharibacteria bacterium]|nr:GspE/PulE family protein [Candidatus Saccharibacteria bacterium]
MALLTDDTIQKIIQSIVASGVISSEELQQKTAAAQAAGVPVITHLRNEKIITDEDITKYIAEATGKNYVSLLESHIEAEVLREIPFTTASRLMVVPIGVNENGTLRIAALDPDNLQVIDIINSLVGRQLDVYMASQASINSVLAQYRLNIEGDVGAVEGDQTTNGDFGDASDTEVKEISQDSPVSQIIAKLLDYAARQNASDVHIEPTSNALLVRCRIDGILRLVTTLPRNIAPAVISRIKILSNLKIDEHRKPMDGQFTVKVGEQEIDLRIAISPVIWGEQCVIRLLKKDATSLKLEDMGMSGRTLRTIRVGLARTNGIIIVSGPTGSGKSTTLQALIREILSEKINIVTLEDPVEYKIEGVNQIQVDANVGLTFAAGLRSILRQDPDVILVGEIRDQETAELAVQAALTGHVVLSTLHTNSAAGILPRLLDMGIEPFLIASTVNVALAQRLVRRNVKERRQRRATESETEEINMSIGHLLPQHEDAKVNVASDLGYPNIPIHASEYALYDGVKSITSPDGFKGRMGIYEAMLISERIQDLVVKHASSSEIEKIAIEEGMITMKQDGYLKALNGDTTLDEVNRVAA